MSVSSGPGVTRRPCLPSKPVSPWRRVPNSPLLAPPEPLKQSLWGRALGVSGFLSPTGDLAPCPWLGISSTEAPGTLSISKYSLHGMDEASHLFLRHLVAFESPGKLRTLPCTTFFNHLFIHPTNITAPTTRPRGFRSQQENTVTALWDLASTNILVIGQLLPLPNNMGYFLPLDTICYSRLRKSLISSYPQYVAGT